jgi:hypothetical protein
MTITLKPGSRELLAQAEALLATIGLTPVKAASLAMAVTIVDEVNDPDIWDKPPTWDEYCSAALDDAYDAYCDNLANAGEFFNDDEE